VKDLEGLPQECACSQDLFLGVVKLIGMEAHHVPYHLAHVPAWIGVVAYIGDALRRQVLRANGQNLILNLIRNPGVHTMTNDIVKKTPGCTYIQDAAVFYGMALRKRPAFVWNLVVTCLIIKLFHIIVSKSVMLIA